MRPGERTLRLFLRSLEPLLTEPETTDLVVNRPGEVGAKRRGHWEWFEFPELTFDRLDAIATLAAAYTEQDIAPATPLCSTTLPYWHRVQLCRPPATLPGIISITARKQSTTLPTIN